MLDRETRALIDRLMQVELSKKKGSPLTGAHIGDIVMDAADALFVDRQLEAIDNRIFQKKYANLKARAICPINNFGGWASRITYQMFDQFGEAQLISDYSKDMPQANASVDEESVKVRDYGVAATYSWRELQAALQAAAGGMAINTGEPLLEQRKLEATRDAAERALDRVCAIGDSSVGLEGLLNHSAITPEDVASGSSDTEWTTKTADEIIADFEEAFTTMENASKGNHTPNLVILPILQFGILKTRPRSTHSDTTIYQFLKEVYPEIDIVSWYRCSGVGAGTTDRMVVAHRDPMNFEMRVPVDYMRLPPQPQAMSFVVPTMIALAGVELRYAGSLLYRDAI